MISSEIKFDRLQVEGDDFVDLLVAGMDGNIYLYNYLGEDLNKKLLVSEVLLIDY